MLGPQAAHDGVKAATPPNIPPAQWSGRKVTKRRERGRGREIKREVSFSGKEMRGEIGEERKSVPLLVFSLSLIPWQQSESPS